MAGSALSYSKGAVVGKGTWGSVRLGTIEKSGRKVAIKEIHRSMERYEVGKVGKQTGGRNGYLSSYPGPRIRVLHCRSPTFQQYLVVISHCHCIFLHSFRRGAAETRVSWAVSVSCLSELTGYHACVFILWPWIVPDSSISRHSLKIGRSQFLCAPGNQDIDGIKAPPRG